jgi:hypothetical protein
MIRLTPQEWQQRQAAHEARVAPWITPRLQRRRLGQAHPVDDFLFEYYPYSPSKLQRWHPGFGVLLTGDAADLAAFLDHPDYAGTTDGATVSLQRMSRHIPRLRLVSTLLRGTDERPANFGCFGMHEWAMVYGESADRVRHTSVPLRLPPDRIRRVVDEVGLRCTHIDAFRFFTDEARPINDYEPTRATQPEMEQRGCVHANMDLYKYAMWFSPFIRSERVADAFEMARTARELDMRAAPYDLTGFGYAPIRLETPAGRREYVDLQRQIAERAQPIRQALAADIAALLTNVAGLCPDSRSQLDPMPA